MFVCVYVSMYICIYIYINRHKYIFTYTLECGIPAPVHQSARLVPFFLDELLPPRVSSFPAFLPLAHVPPSKHVRASWHHMPVTCKCKPSNWIILWMDHYLPSSASFWASSFSFLEASSSFISFFHSTSCESLSFLNMPLRLSDSGEDRVNKQPAFFRASWRSRWVFISFPTDSVGVDVDAVVGVGQGVNIGVSLGFGLIVGYPPFTSLDTEGARQRFGSLVT